MGTSYQGPMEMSFKQFPGGSSWQFKGVESQRAGCKTKPSIATVRCLHNPSPLWAGFLLELVALGPKKWHRSTGIVRQQSHGNPIPRVSTVIKSLNAEYLIPTSAPKMSTSNPNPWL